MVHLQNTRIAIRVGNMPRAYALLQILLPGISLGWRRLCAVVKTPSLTKSRSCMGLIDTGSLRVALVSACVGVEESDEDVDAADEEEEWGLGAQNSCKCRSVMQCKAGQGRRG